MEMEVGGEGGAGETAYAVEGLLLGVVKVVDDPDRETLLKELENGVSANEAGAAGDQHGPHDLRLRRHHGRRGSRKEDEICVECEK